MNTAFGSLGLAVALGLGMASMGCARNGTAKAPTDAANTKVGTTTLTGGELPVEPAEELPPMAQVNDRAGANAARGRQGREQGQQARLVVSNDIVAHCPNVQMMGDHDFDGPAEEAWVAVLGSVAACLNKGDLGAKDLRVTGPNEGSTAVGYVLSKLGVDLARVQAVDDFEEDLCIHDHSCVVSTVRIEAVDRPKDEGTHI